MGDLSSYDGDAIQIDNSFEDKPLGSLGTLPALGYPPHGELLNSGFVLPTAALSNPSLLDENESKSLDSFFDGAGRNALGISEHMPGS